MEGEVNHWMLIGDWAPMPMNVREPKSDLCMRWGEPVPNTTFSLLHGECLGRHYDVIVMDDACSKTKVDVAKLEELCKSVGFTVRGPTRSEMKAQACTATEVMMAGQARMNQLLGRCPERCVGSRVRPSCQVGDTKIYNCGHTECLTTTTKDQKV